jgi:vancomycin permeability regulator SanA
MRGKIVIFVILFFFFLFGIILRSQTVFRVYEEDIYTELADTPTAPVALIFGAGILNNTTPSDALRDRLDAGVALYKAKKVRKLVMTGDNGRDAHDEVSVMKQYALKHNIPEKDIILDHAGFRTYDSCYRARDVFGLWDVIAISQEFHLPRVLYTCNQLDVHAVGYVADKQPYLLAHWYSVREFMARFKAWYQIKITKPLPKFLGEKEMVF